MVGHVRDAARRLRVRGDPGRLARGPRRVVHRERERQPRLLDDQRVHPLSTLLVEEAGDERHHHHSAGIAHPGQHVVGHVARVVAQRPRRGVREERRRDRHVQRRVHRRRRDVRQVGEHAEPVELADHLAAEVVEPADPRLVGRAVRPVGVADVGERQVPGAERVQHPQHAQRVADQVAALDTGQGRDAPGGHRPLHVVGVQGQHEVVGVAPGRAAVPGRSAPARWRRPRGRRGAYTDQNWAPTRPVRSRGRSVCSPVADRSAREVERVEVAAHPAAQLPRQVVVPVEYRIVHVVTVPSDIPGTVSAQRRADGA